MAKAVNTRWYVGPIDAIATFKLDKTEVVLNRGDAITGTDEDVARWDAQPENYSSTDPSAPAQVATETVDPTPDQPTKSSAGGAN